MLLSLVAIKKVHKLHSLLLLLYLMFASRGRDADFDAQDPKAKAGWTTGCWRCWPFSAVRCWTCAG